MKRIETDFESAGTRCAAWLFLPESGAEAGRPPVVVMAHGFGGQRVPFPMFRYQTLRDSATIEAPVLMLAAEHEECPVAPR